jgi:hypothetical protein
MTTATVLNPKEAKYVDTVLAQSVEIRKEITAEGWHKYGRFAYLFQQIFGDDRNILKAITDLHYYQGGWPSENTPARLDTLLHKFGQTYQYFEVLGRTSDINDFLHSNYGIKISRTKQMPVKIVKGAFEENLVKKYMKELGVKYTAKQTPAQILSGMISECMELQGFICEKADQIKIENYGKVNQIIKVEKGQFSKTVNLKARKQNLLEKKKSPTRVKEKVEDISGQAENFVTILKKV